MDWRDSLANALVESQAREVMVHLLGNVPGFPPIVQSFHILGIAVVMASIVMVDLRFIGIAVPSQNISEMIRRLSEMIRRLMPWMWWALLLNAITGSVFVIANPLRYFYNPVFAWKFTFLVPVIVLALIVHRFNLREQRYWEQSFGRHISGRLIAITSLLLWIGVIMAVHRFNLREQRYWEQSFGRHISGRLIAITSLLLWIGVIMAGRWIAYSDYLYYYE